ncbi:hypothetical protein [Streptomyces brevispora]|uniref:Uncharacterized protein n=1 Tax=Streptomyces brevispora TaxID=887462 RepID=A0A561TYI1_9ACTN|nr:hypothetical protein [Streptomyces brevispora]TWF92173.1 hypothetical protein FHX80_12492 [Streptomyces brevispora]WSC11526.1 hypothetical protein OIE64_00625 [Streptomyces brevispora]WSC17585.1 hypothetical protein OIE64_35415 [Streptomyces brevispora]
MQITPRADDLTIENLDGTTGAVDDPTGWCAILTPAAVAAQ